MSSESHEVGKGALEHRQQYGAISMAIFVRELERSDGELFRVRSTVIERSYFHEPSQTWRRTSSFSLEDLPRVRLAAEDAFRFCLMARQRDRAEDVEQ